jgi:hypothetical protein
MRDRIILRLQDLRVEVVVINVIYDMRLIFCYDIHGWQDI